MERFEFCDRFGLASDVEKRRNGWPFGLKKDKCSPFIYVISSSSAARSRGILRERVLERVLESPDDGITNLLIATAK